MCGGSSPRALVLALAVAFAPVMLPLAVLLALVVVLGTLLAHGSLATAGWSLVAGSGPPSAPRRSTFRGSRRGPGTESSALQPIGEAGLGLVPLASFEIGSTDFAALALALYLPVVAGVMLARAWRLTWAIRSA